MELGALMVGTMKEAHPALLRLNTIDIPSSRMSFDDGSLYFGNIQATRTAVEVQ